MVTISFYSYKGGTGRTLVVANAARHLARLGLKVVALDFDLEAPGLHYKFRSDQSGEPVTVQKGVVDYLYEFVTEQRIPDSLSDYVVEVSASDHSDAVIQLISAGNVPSADYWQKLAQISWHELFYAPNAKGIHLFLELKEQIREEFKPDFLLIDSRTGITEVGGVATTVLPEKLVCLVLPNRENLEGARAVLRSLRHAPRLPETSPPEVTVILSRVPSADMSTGEEALIEKTLAFLNEEADNVEDTLAIPEVIVLHSEPDLLVRECLRVGGDKSPDESVLLRDYLRLFMRIIPNEVVLPHVGTLIDHAKKVAFDDPDGAQNELESLTHLGVPEVYRELLKFYRLRNVSGKPPLQMAQRLWELTDDSSDPLLWDTVSTHFAETYPQTRSYGSVLKGDLPFLRFVEVVWRQAGATHVDVGCDLAESFRNFDHERHAADLLVELVRHVGSNEKAVVQCLRQLERVGRIDEARDLIEKSREPLSRSPVFLKRWAEFALGQRDEELIQEITKSDVFQILSESDPGVAVRVLLVADRAEDAGVLAQRALNDALHRSPSRVAEVGRLFAELDKFDEFERIVKERFGEAMARDILSESVFEQGQRSFIARRARYA